MFAGKCQKSIAWKEADRVLNICASAIDRHAAIEERTIVTSGIIVALQCDEDVDFPNRELECKALLEDDFTHIAMLRMYPKSSI